MADFNFPRDFTRSSSRGSGSSSRGRSSGSSRGGSSRSSYGGFGGYSEEKPTVTLDRDTLKSLNLLFANVDKRNEEERLSDIKEKKRLAEEKEKKDTEAIEKITKELLAKIEKSGETMEEAVKRNTKSKELQKAIISMSSYIKQQEEAKKEEETKKKGFRHMTTKRYDKDNLDQLRQASIKKAFEERKEQDLENKAMQKAMKEVMAFSKKTKMSTEKSMEALGISEHLREPLQEKIEEKKEGGGFIKQMTGKISEIKDAIMEGFEAHDVAIKGAIFGPLNLLIKPMEDFFGPFVKGFKNLFGHKKKDVFKQKPGRNDVVKTADMGALFIADTMTKLLGPKDEETGKRKGGFLSKTKDKVKGFFKKTGDKVKSIFHKESPDKNIANVTNNDANKNKGGLLERAKEGTKGFLKNTGEKIGSLFHKKSDKKNSVAVIKKDIPTRHDIVKTADMGALFIADTMTKLLGPKDEETGKRKGGFLSKTKDKVKGFFKKTGDKVKSIFHKESPDKNIANVTNNDANKNKGGLLERAKEGTKGFLKNTGEKIGSLFHKKSDKKNSVAVIKKDIPTRHDIVKTADMGALYIADTIQTVMGKKENKKDGGILGKIGKKLEDLFGGITKKILGLVGGLASGLLGKIFGGFLKKAGVSSIGGLIKKAIPSIAEFLVTKGPLLAGIGIALLAGYGIYDAITGPEKKKDAILKKVQFDKLSPDKQKSLLAAGITPERLQQGNYRQLTPEQHIALAGAGIIQATQNDYRNVKEKRFKKEQQSEDDPYRPGNYWKKTGANDYSYSMDGGNTWKNFGKLYNEQAPALLDNLSNKDRASLPRSGSPKDLVDSWFGSPNNPDSAKGIAKFAKGGLVIPRPGNSRGIPAVIAEHGKPEAVFNGRQLDKILEGSLGSVEVTRLLNELVSINDQGNKTNKEIQLTEEKSGNGKGVLGGTDSKDTSKKLDTMIALLQKLVDKKITVNTPRQTHQDLVGILSGGGLY